MARTDSTRTATAKRDTIARRQARAARTARPLDLAALTAELHAEQDARRTADLIAFPAHRATYTGAPSIAV